MPKNLFQDMVRAKNSEKRIPRTEAPEYVKTQMDMPRMVPTNRGQSGSKYGVWVVAALCVVFFAFALSFFFAKAQVSIDPKVRDIVLEENLSAIKDSNNDGLAFDLVIISGEEVKKVSGGEEQQLSLKSKGTVFIYNSLGVQSQKLAANTSLEGSNGKIYKTIEAVVVPGVDAEGNAGKIEVQIQGSLPGVEFNSEPLDFKISGFKGTPKYEKIYARSVGPISGGFEGMSPLVSEVEKEIAFGALKETLGNKLLQKAIDQIPPGFILYKEATFLNIDEQNAEFLAVEGGVPVKMKATLYGFLISEKKLTQKIAKDNITDYDDSEVYMPNIRSLNFALLDKDISFRDVQNINFKLSGTAKVVWKFDDATFAESLLGKSRSEFNDILASYKNIDSAELSLSPFWVRSIPGKLEDINVIVNYPK